MRIKGYKQRQRSKKRWYEYGNQQMIPGLTEESWKLRKSGWRQNKEGPEYKDKE